MSRIGVVTVTHNSASVLPDFLSSVWKQSHADFILYVVDSGSTDATAERLGEISDARARVVLTGKNIGFAAGCNLGARMALKDDCDSILLINNDTVFDADLFEKLMRGLEEWNCAMTTPKMVYHDRPDTIWAAGGHFNRWLAWQNLHDGENQTNDGKFDRPRQVSFTPFCCVLIRANAYRTLGPLDENYFVYTEDADYCYRALKAGLAIRYLSEASLQHKVSALTVKMSDFMVYYCTRNRMYFLRKNFGRVRSFVWTRVFAAHFRLRHWIGRDSDAFWEVKSKALRDGRTLTPLPARRGDGIAVHVHLSHGQGASTWRGPDRVPYGYHQAERLGCDLTFSHDHCESRFARFFRRSLHRILGFDLIYAYRNRDAMMRSDVIWTHTEHEHLAVLALLRWRSADRRPKIIAQSVHLYDVWNQLSPWKRSVNRRLMRSADVLTVHSKENLLKCHRIFPDRNCRLVPFGISLDDFPMTIPNFNPAHGKLKIASLGSDMHRDWDLLLNAIQNRDDIEARIAIPARKRDKVEGLFKNKANCALVSVSSLREILDLYAWCDVVVVPIAANLHVSGITVILEAVTQGKPVIAADTGGLDGYFSKDEIFYYECGNADSLLDALSRCIDDPGRTRAAIARAQTRIIRDELTSAGYAKRHVELSRELLSGENPEMPLPDHADTLHAS